jgi:hypothetical protein
MKETGTIMEPKLYLMLLLSPSKLSSPRSIQVTKVPHMELCAIWYQCCLHVLMDLLEAQQENNLPQAKHPFHIRNKKWTV